MKYKKGDTVAVIAGAGHIKVNKQGKKEYYTGKILKVIKDKNKVVVEGFNKVKKHQRPTQQNEKGKIIEVEAPIDASNILFYDKESKKPSRIGFRVDEKGNKVRYSKSSGKVIK